MSSDKKQSSFPSEKLRLTGHKPIKLSDNQKQDEYIQYLTRSRQLEHGAQSRNATVLKFVTYIQLQHGIGNFMMLEVHDIEDFKSAMLKSYNHLIDSKIIKNEEEQLESQNIIAQIANAVLPSSNVINRPPTPIPLYIPPFQSSFVQEERVLTPRKNG